jgi:drug/metabolite transporter (DMT)-like permease
MLAAGTAETAELEHCAGKLPNHRQESASILTLRPGTIRAMRTSGTILCLASAAAFGAMAIFGKLAYDEGATVGTLLAVRFALAAALLWMVLLATGAAADVRAAGARAIAIAVALGALGYAAQSGAYFAALQRIDASLLSMLVYTFPAIVAVAAIALGRERADGRRVAAVALATAGLVLILAGTGAGPLDPLGAALGLAAALVYSVYILVGESVVGLMRPLVLATLVCTSAAISLSAGAAAAGELQPGELTAAAWGWLACLAAVSTVAAIGLFFAGLERVGPTSASMLSTVEPLVTVLLAFVAFGETLAPVQMLGGGLVLGGVVALQARVV